ALVLAKLHEVLLLDGAPELGDQVLRVFGAAVEGEQTVEVREDGGAQTAALFLSKREEPSQALRGQDQVRAVLAQFGENALVVRAGNRVELGNVDADRGAGLCAQAGLFGDGEGHQIEQRAPDERRGVFTDDPAGGVDNDNGTAAQPVRGVDGGDWLADDVPSR